MRRICIGRRRQTLRGKVAPGPRKRPRPGKAKHARCDCSVGPFRLFTWMCAWIRSVVSVSVFGAFVLSR